MWEPKCWWRLVCNQPLKTTGSSSSCSSSKSAKEDGKQSREVALMARKWAESALQSCLSKGPGVTHLLSIACCRKSELVTLKRLLHVCALWQYTVYYIYNILWVYVLHLSMHMYTHPSVWLSDEVFSPQDLHSVAPHSSADPSWW